ncbi:gluconokinase [Piscinibacter sp.]|uniref:gluconokinase n=1 Tax=Piscinibacter sp. TaxID=1903157 RepID=UPI002CD50A1F|nr:gluconokinase [Albitalea sp.]HUG24909.1 gluconokinase [Albitalea sp.]
MQNSLVIMGVAGCGKSSVGQAVAADLGWILIEGDEFHGADNLAKMSRGIALTDADRATWLAMLAAQLQVRPQGAVLTCSALKRAYRDRLRAAAPGLGFVFLQIDRELALARVAARGSHFFSPALVDSQFAALEDPSGEARVLRLDASASIDSLRGAVAAWLRTEEAA